MGVNELAQLASWEVVLMQKPKDVTAVLVCSRDGDELLEECQTFASTNQIKVVNLSDD